MQIHRSPNSILGLIVAATGILLALLIWAKTHGAIVIDIEKPFDIATLLLVAATLVLTAVGALAAFVTLIGYKEIRSESIRVAKVEGFNAGRAEATKLMHEVILPEVLRETRRLIAENGTPPAMDFDEGSNGDKS